MIRNAVSLVLITSAMCLLFGCEIFGSLCDTAAYPAVEISVKNSDGDFIAQDVTAVIFEGNYQDTLLHSGINELGQVTKLEGGIERDGNYSLIITSDLYESYTETNIRVSDGKCHVQTQKLSITLDSK